MGRPPPCVYLLYGDNSFAIEEEVCRLRDRLGDPTTISMNYLRFAARSASVPDVAAACAAMPFLAHRRLVVLDGIESLAKTPTQQVLDLLPSVPPSTGLVLTAEIDSGRRNAMAEFETRNRLFQWVNQNAEMGYHRAFILPKARDFELWIQERGRKLGVDITPQAAALLAASTMGDPRSAETEIHKLADYVDYRRPVALEDVERLSPAARQTDVFAMVDALGQRDAHNTLKHLNRLLLADDARALFPMVVRQFRLILLARHALDAGLNPQETLPVPPFVARKVASQARNFSAADLELIYHRLLEIDVDSKTGQGELATSLHSLVAGLAS